MLPPNLAQPATSRRRALDPLPARRSPRPLARLALTCCLGLVTLLGPAARPALAQDELPQKWAATWATSMATTFVYAPPVAGTLNIQPDQIFAFPNANGNAATDQTFRTIIKPDLWGKKMRFKFSNVFGTQPVTFDAVSVGLQKTGAIILGGTLTPVLFGGQRTVTIPPGQELFSDMVKLPFLRGPDDALVKGRNLAVNYSVRGNSGPMTYHLLAWATSYVTAPGSGDHTGDEKGYAFEFTTTSFFFLSEVDVMAPADTRVICAFGDSITDGRASTLNANDRWADELSPRLHNAYGNRVSVVVAAIAGNRVLTPGTPTQGPAAVDRLDRDVLGLSGLTDVIWLEGINDVSAGATPEAIIGGYQNVVGRLHARGVKVYAGTLTSALNPTLGGAALATNQANDAKRQQVNGFIRTGGLFDGTEDFDAATLDPATGAMQAKYLPASTFALLPLDYLHPNHAGYLKMGLAVDITPFAPLTR